MKKIHAVIFLLALFISIPFAVKADVVVLAQLTLKDAHVVSSSGGTYSISFTIHNGGDVQTNVKYGIRLIPVVGGIPNYSMVANEKFASESLSINPNRDVSRTMSYTVPASLDGSYKILVVINNTNGLPLGSSFVADVSTHSKSSISINTASCYLTVEGEKSAAHYTLDQGVDVATYENLLLNCKATNTADQMTPVTPETATFLRSESGVSVYTPAIATSFSFGPKETKTIVIPISKPSKPQAYTSVIDLAGAPGSVPSNSVSIHWVLRGMSGTIQNISLDKTIYKAGDTAVVSFVWTGQADSFIGSRIGTSTLVSNLLAHVSVCDQGVDYPLKGNSGSEHVAIPLSSDCVNPHVLVSLVSGDTVLSAQDATISSPEAIESGSTSGQSSSVGGSLDAGIIVAIAVILLLVIAVAVIAIRSKNGRSLFVVVIAGSALYSAYSVHAMVGGGYSNSRNSQNQTPATVTKYILQLTGTSPSVNAKYTVRSEVVPAPTSTPTSIEGKINNFLDNALNRTQQQATQDANKMNTGALGIAEIVQKLRTASQGLVALDTTSSFKDESGVVYTCNFNVFPRIDATVSGLASGRPVPPGAVFSLNMHSLANPTCSYLSAGATTTTPVSFDAVLTLSGSKGVLATSGVLSGATPTGSLVNPTSKKADKYSISAQYNVALSNGHKIGTYNEVVQTGDTSPYEAVGVVLDSGGGTIEVSTSAAQNYVATTISLNGTSFDPGKPVTVTATDPVVVLCTNGASGALYINYDVYKIGNDTSLHSETNTHALTNHTLVNSAASPLAPGSYYVVAKYYAPKINLWHQVLYNDELEAVVIIPFIVNGASATSGNLTSPVITRASGMCLPAKTPEALISWKPVSAAQSYSIYRSADGVAFDTVATGIATDTNSFVDTGVPASTPGTFGKYMYRVSALDAASNASSTDFGIIFPDCSNSSTTPPVTGAPFCQFAVSQHQVMGAAGPVTVGDISWSSLNTDSCTGTGFTTNRATSGSASVFVNYNTTFGLSCLNAVSNQTCQTSSTVNVGSVGPTTGTGSCIAPQNAVLCVNSDSSAAASGSAAVLRGNNAACTSSVSAPVMCEFFCPSNFQKSGNHCVLGGSIQEQ